MNRSMHYSFVVPIYNDGSLVEAFCLEFRAVFQYYLASQEIDDQVELIFVNDGSKNDSILMLKQAANTFSFVRIIDLSRNFGQHIALSCGYENASGLYVGMLNVDMQDPPNQIPALLDFIKNNDYDIVFGLRQDRHSSLFDKITSFCFNYALNKLTGQNVPLNVATIRVMNRRFVDAYNLLTEKSRYLPGLESWLGFKHGYIETIHRERLIGRSSYSFKKRILMAVDSIISFSDLPLKSVALFGLAIALIGFILLLILIIQRLFFIEFLPGFAATASISIFLGGVQILVIGLSSLYIGRILKEVQNRPLYIVREIYSQQRPIALSRSSEQRPTQYANSVSESV
jgi:glycosyltransferase involved in cell wall biosynthesis